MPGGGPSAAESARAQCTRESSPQGHPGHLPPIGASSRGAAGSAVHHGCGSQGGALSGAGGGDDGDFGCVGAGGMSMRTDAHSRRVFPETTR